MMIAVMWLVPLVLAVAALPCWPYSRAWGYVPSGGLLAIALAVFLLHVWSVI